MSPETPPEHDFTAEASPALVLEGGRDFKRYASLTMSAAGNVTFMVWLEKPLEHTCPLLAYAVGPKWQCHVEWNSQGRPSLWIGGDTSFDLDPKEVPAIRKFLGMEPDTGFDHMNEGDALSEMSPDERARWQSDQHRPEPGEDDYSPGGDEIPF